MKIRGEIVRIATWFLAVLPALWLLTHPIPVSWLIPFARKPYSPAYVLGYFWPVLLWCLVPSLLAWRDWKWRRPVTFGWIAILFCLWQAYCYNAAAHPGASPFTIWGLFPGSDSQTYINDAVEIAEGTGIRVSFGARQTWPGFLALLHVWCHGDLKLMLSLLALMQASVAYIAWEMVHQLLGRSAAFIWLCCVAFFCRAYVTGLFMTEQLGLPLGMLAAVLLFYAWRVRSIANWLLGLSLLIFALSSRPGCYFVIPFLLIGTFWRFRQMPLPEVCVRYKSLRYFAWRRASIAIALTLLCLAADSLSFRHLVNPPRMPSNFWMVLYGTAKGGTWANSLENLGGELYDPKKIGIVSDYERLHSFLDNVKHAAIKEIAAKPQMLLYGTLRAWQYVILHQTFFYESSAGWWGWLLLVISAVALLLGSLNKDIGLSDAGFFWLVWLGVFLSLALAPPWDSGARTYAATNPLIWLTPATFCSWCAKYFSGSRSSKVEINSPTYASRENGGANVKTNLRLHSIAGVLLVVASVLLPNILLEVNRNKAMPRYSGLIHLEKPSADVEQIPGALLPHNRGIIVNPAKTRTFLPQVAREDFEHGAPRGRQVAVGEFLKDLPNGSYIALLERPRYLICDPSVVHNGHVQSNIPLRESDWMAYTYIFALSKGLVLTPRQFAIVCPSSVSHQLFWSPKMPSGN